MAGNKNLKNAHISKKNEFYTQYEDIQAELNHYIEHFKGKTILCNCDDPVESQFCFYFLKNFNFFNLKRLICTCFRESPVAFTIFDYLKDDFDENATRHNGYVLDIKSIPMANGRGVSNEDITKLLHSKKVKRLNGDGDFRSEEVVEYLKQSDIVVTNPPFSLFREYVAQLVKYEKKFIIIGHQNAIGYKEIFPLLKENKIWLGYGFKGGAGFFSSPYEDNAKASHHKEGLIRVSGVNWFTNLDIEKRHEDLIGQLTKKYNKNEYKKYENYNAINVNKTLDMPKDYFGVMGVPITFMDKYNPEQFEIVGLGIANLGLSCGVKPYKKAHKEYRKNIQKRGAVDGDLYMLDKNGHPEVPYSRILVKRRDK